MTKLDETRERYYAAKQERDDAEQAGADDATPPSHGFDELLEAKKLAVYYYQELCDLRQAMRGAEHPCADEKHCSCVPLLHGIISTLRKEIVWAATKLLDLDEITFTRACDIGMLTRDEMKKELKKVETEK